MTRLRIPIIDIPTSRSRQGLRPQRVHSSRGVKAMSDDETVGREEGAGRDWLVEALNAPLTLACGLMRVLTAVVKWALPEGAMGKCR